MKKVCLHFKQRKLIQYDKSLLYRCPQCGLIFANKKKLNLKYLYKNYYKNELSIGKFRNGVEMVVKLFRFFRAFKVYTLSRYSQTILDVGSGRGFMLYFLKKYYHYHQLVGTQIDQRMIRFSRKKLGLKIYGKDLLKIPFKKASFDIVTVWHVLEHLKNPEKYLKKISQLLKKKGKLIIEVPNFNSWTRSLTGRYWLGLDLKYHLNFFTPQSLSYLLLNQNFKIKNVHTFSLEYSIFFSVQSVVSRLTKSDHLFFSWLQVEKFKPEIIYHLLLFLLFTPLCFLINLMLFFSKKGEILLVVAEKK